MRVPHGQRCDDLETLKRINRNFTGKLLSFRANNDRYIVPIANCAGNVIGCVFFVDALARTYMLRIKLYGNPVNNVNYKCFQL